MFCPSDVVKCGAGIKANGWLGSDQRVLGKARVRSGVRHHESRIEPATNGVIAEGPVARRLGGVQAHARFEPLPMLIDQRNQRYRRIKQGGCQRGQAIEPLVGQGCLGRRNYAAPSGA